MQNLKYHWPVDTDESVAWMLTSRFALAAQVKIRALHTFVAETTNSSLTSITSHSKVNLSLTISIRRGSSSSRGSRLGWSLNDEAEWLILLALGIHQGRNQLIITWNSDLVTLLICEYLRILCKTTQSMIDYKYTYQYTSNWSCHEAAEDRWTWLSPSDR